MDTGSYRFKIGEFECVCVSEGALDFPHPKASWRMCLWSA